MEGKIFSWDFLMTTVLFRLLLVYGRTILVLQIFFINLPLKLFNFNFMFFFLKIILILNLEEKNLAGQEKKIYSDFHSIIIYLPFSQYSCIIIYKILKKKKLFQHFANLIKIRSTRLLPILDLIIPRSPKREGGILFYLCPSVLPKYFSSHFSQQLLMAEI